MVEPTPWPSKISLSVARDVLRVEFDNGDSFGLAAEYLRVESPSAEVRGHHPDQRKTVAGKRLVKISAVEPTGNYAVRLVFDDGHDTGLYTWAYLHRLGDQRRTIWQSYLDELEKQGLARSA
ncbi:MAG: gamma-butyrobetaine hydroxylase-like domain-containing protein [Alphaproteobacteria bacterium]